MTFLGPETDAREIDVSVMRAYVPLLAAKNLSRNSRNHALRVFKAFGKFLVDEGILDENVFRLIPHAKLPERLIEPPTVEAGSTPLDGEVPTTWPPAERGRTEPLSRNRV